MPSFSPDDFDVDVDDFLDECSESDIRDIIDYLIENDYISSEHKHSFKNDSNICAAESMFEDEISKLHNNWNRLTAEEEQTILNITKRF
jgi:hypothetical protein